PSPTRRSSDLLDIKPRQPMQHKGFSRHTPSRMVLKKKGDEQLTALQTTFRRENLSLAGCSSAEPASVSVQQYKIQISKLYLQPVEIPSHFQYPPAAINALKDALTHIYWTKGDLRRFIFNTLSSNTNSIVGTIDWANQTKYESASELIDRMCARQDLYRNDLLALFEQVINFNDFSHLKRWDDAEKKIQRAKDAVGALRKQAKGYFDVAEEKKKTEQRKKVAQEKVKSTTALKTKLDELNQKFMEIATSSDAQKRGYGLEKLLNELFTLFDLDPKASFKITGEQIDGAF